MTPDLHFHYEKIYKFEYDFLEYWKKSDEENNRFYKDLKKIEQRNLEEYFCQYFSSNC